MPKRGCRASGSSAARSARRRAGAGSAAGAADDTFASSNLSLHDLFQQQIRSMLDRTDLDEEQKQGVLIAAACPCCGAGGMSFTAKIRRRP